MFFFRKLKFQNDSIKFWNVFPMLFNSESLEILVVISGNVLLFKDIKN